MRLEDADIGQRVEVVCGPWAGFAGYVTDVWPSMQQVELCADPGAAACVSIDVGDVVPLAHPALPRLRTGRFMERWDDEMGCYAWFGGAA